MGMMRVVNQATGWVHECSVERLLEGCEGEQGMFFLWMSVVGKGTELRNLVGVLPEEVWQSALLVLQGMPATSENVQNEGRLGEACGWWPTASSPHTSAGKSGALLPPPGYPARLA